VIEDSLWRLLRSLDQREQESKFYSPTPAVAVIELKPT
jgi:hypothetical protein